ncbi:hypothetical protein [Pedobacter ureilyticus]|uniref:Uncharacterized protein n=1 Tax=Pedobacter ureilyticus TaxID=1393051 RepID=A0ABW9J7E9_9SPHI|nr:hypothetical protein [Pedobacter helvus]
MAKDFILNGTNCSNYSGKSPNDKDYSATVVKNYVDQRKEKAEKQKQDERNGISNAKLSEQKWDEMKSYRYAIF